MVFKYLDQVTRLLGVSLELIADSFGRNHFICLGKPAVCLINLDMAALIADKERGKIKSFKVSAEGALTVELYSAADAQEKIAKMHGLYKEDNGQKAAKFNFENLDDNVLNARINANR